MARQRKRKEFSWLGGGLVTLPRDAQKEALQKGRLFCPNITNVDLFRPGSARLFTKFNKRGTTMLGTSPKSEQSVGNDWNGLNVSLYSSFGIGQIFASADARAAQSLTMTMRWTAGLSGSMVAKIYTVSASLPNTLVATSSPFFWNNAAASAGQDVTFYFTTLPALTVANYYFTLEMTVGTVPAGCELDFRVDGLSSATIAHKYNAGGWAQNAEVPFKYLLQAGDPPVSLLYDARFQSPGPVQYYMGANGGYLLAGDPDTVDAGGGWDNPIWAGGNSSRFQLWDAKQMGGLVFTTDYSTSFPRAWDGVRGPDRTPVQTDANSTMQAGYKSPLTVARAAGASVWSATGLVQVLIITTLKSGGWRATYGSVVLQNTTDVINLTAMAFDSVPAQFYFDIDAAATEVFVTAPGRGVFYKYPAASLSGGANPMANNTTTQTITGVADATIEAQQDLESDFGVPTGYFTEQIDAPKAKYLETFSNCLCAAGDPTFPFGVFITAQDAPQIWSEYGRTYGVRLDIMPEDGEPVTGLKVADRALFVAKPHFLYRVDFTGDANLPWRVTRVHGSYGTYSHWSMQVIPQGLLFLDDSGPAICFGTYSALAPGSDKIVNLFDARVAADLNIWWAPISQRALSFASSALESGFNRVTWTLAQGSAADASKAVLLIYDFQQQQFTTRIQPANVLAIIGDADGFPKLWKGDYAGQAWAISDADYSTADVVEIETPWMDLDESSIYKDGEWLWLFGQKIDSAPPSSIWNVVVYVDGNDPPGPYFSNVQVSQVLQFDAASPEFSAGGVALRLACRAWRRIKLRIFGPSAGKAAALDGFAIEWTPEGERR